MPAETTRSLLALYSVILLSLTGITTPLAQSARTPISDGFLLFMNYCVTTLGIPERAEKQLDGSNSLARKLPAEATAKLQQGLSGGSAWAIRSPKREGYLLEYHPKGICSVRFQEISQSQALAEFEIFVSAIKQKISPVKSNRKELDKGIFKTVEYTMLTHVDAYKIAMSASEKRISEQTAILSLVYNKNQ